MACGRTLANRSQLSSNNLRLPFRVKGHGQNCSALIAEELEDRDCSLRGLIAGSKRLDNDVGCGIAFRTLALHGVLRVGHCRTCGGGRLVIVRDCNNKIRPAVKLDSQTWGVRYLMMPLSFYFHGG